MKGDDYEKVDEGMEVKIVKLEIKPTLNELESTSEVGTDDSSSLGSDQHDRRTCKHNARVSCFVDALPASLL